MTHNEALAETIINEVLPLVARIEGLDDDEPVVCDMCAAVMLLEVFDDLDTHTQTPAEILMLLVRADDDEATTVAIDDEFIARAEEAVVAVITQNDTQLQNDTDEVDEGLALIISLEVVVEVEVVVPDELF